MIKTTQNSKFKNQKLNSKVKSFAFLLAILTFTFCLLTLNKILAQTPANYDVTVSPVFFDLSANPGGTVSDKIRLRNNTTSPLAIKIEIKRLTGDESGELTLRDTSPDDSLSWIKFKDNTFVAKPLEWSDVSFTIDIPKEAAYGYYYAITFTQDDKNPLAKTGTKITGAAAVPVLLNVRKEGARADAKILEFSIKPYVSEYLPADFTVKIENTGNIHVRPHGNIFISDGRNKNLAILNVNTIASNIIPNTKKTFNVSWDDGFLVKEPVIQNGQVKLDRYNKPVQKLTINWDKLTSFRIGKYTANLLLVFDNGKRDVSLESTVSFWIIPYKAIIIIIASIIMLALLLRFLLKLYIAREIKKRSS